VDTKADAYWVMQYGNRRSEPVSLTIQPWALHELRWSKHYYEEGHPKCICSLCGEVIGVPDDDPRKLAHDPDFCDAQTTGDCDLCEIAIRIFKGEGRDCVAQQYHFKCFIRVCRPRPALGPAEQQEVSQ
jgi:hypothetical protein